MTLADRLQRDWWRPGLGALSTLLLPAAWLYAAVTALRRASYRLGWRSATPLPVPVLVVGNLIVGGAGKTPVVIALVQALRAAGWTPGVISRGYGRSSDDCRPVTARSTAAEVGDEPLLIHLRTHAAVMVGRDRAAAALALCGAHPEVDVIVSDDGLQHLGLARQLQVLVFDERGVGNGCLLPAGPLRQPMPTTVPADSLVLYNAPHASTLLPGGVSRRALGGAVALTDWWKGAVGTPALLQTLRDRSVLQPVLAVAGMAHPERFFAMLEAAGLSIERLPLPDHFSFDRLPWLDEPFRDARPEVVVTEKDAVKLPPTIVGAARVRVVTLDLRLPDDFIAKVEKALRPHAPA